MGAESSISQALTLARVTPSFRARADCESPAFSLRRLMLSEIMFSPPCNYFTIHKMIINYPKVHSFVDNQQGKAYNWKQKVTENARTKFLVLEVTVS